MGIPPREDDEAPLMYFLREFVIPGVVFLVMIRWLVQTALLPMVREKILPTKVQRNYAQDNELLAAPVREKME